MKRLNGMEVEKRQEVKISHRSADLESFLCVSGDIS
jgi:hypothetical protein